MNRRDLPERVLAQQTNNKGAGYKIVTLQIGRGKAYSVSVAPLVCEAFHGPKPRPEMQCAHLNGNSQDNRAENLAWVTPQENEEHKRAHGTKLLGERHHMAVLTEDDVRYIREARARGVKGTVLAKRFGVSTTQICDIHLRKSWRHVA